MPPNWLQHNWSIHTCTKPILILGKDIKIWRSPKFTVSTASATFFFWSGNQQATWIQDLNLIIADSDAMAGPLEELHIISWALDQVQPQVVTNPPSSHWQKVVSYKIVQSVSIVILIRKCEFYTTRAPAVLEPRRFQSPFPQSGWIIQKMVLELRWKKCLIFLKR